MTEPAKVVAIRGGVVTALRECNADVVDALIKTLEAAQSGEIQGIAIGMFYADDTCGSRRAGVVSYSLVGQLAELQRRILVDLE
jgi:hypothetical protein